MVWVTRSSTGKYLWHTPDDLQSAARPPTKGVGKFALREKATCAAIPKCKSASPTIEITHYGFTPSDAKKMLRQAYPGLAPMWF